jgi:hypothetical protein
MRLSRGWHSTPTGAVLNAMRYLKCYGKLTAPNGKRSSAFTTHKREGLSRIPLIGLYPAGSGAEIAHCDGRIAAFRTPMSFVIPPDAIQHTGTFRKRLNHLAGFCNGFLKIHNAKAKTAILCQ